MSHDPKYDAPEFSASQLIPFRRCGRLDPHEPHKWSVDLWVVDAWDVSPTYRCKGFVLIEGGEGCSHCQRPIAECGCYAALVEERRKEWYS